MHNHSVLFIITKQSGLNCLKSFVDCHELESQVRVITFDDTSDERTSFDDIKIYCENNAIEFKVVESNKEFIETIPQYNVDSVFVCGWYWIIPNSVLTYFNNQVFGIHHSLLPKYRGFSPLVWSMINADKVIGSSLFKISDGIDVGDVYFQWSVNREEKNISQVLSELESKIANNFGSIFKKILKREIIGNIQNHSQATYCARRSIESGLIDWSLSAEDILCFIRAQSEPYPGAYFEIGDERFVIETAELFSKKVHSKPGQVVMYLDTGVIIGCGDGFGIEVKELRNKQNLRRIFYSHDLILGSRK